MPIPKSKATDIDQHPPLFMEALAYHESGHAVMTVLLGLPIAKVTIGPACRDPGFNGHVSLALEQAQEVLAFKIAFMEVASEHSEKLSPNYEQFRTIHRKYRHLKPFSIGVKSDLARGFDAAKGVYLLLGFAESTAKKQFKADYRDVAGELIAMNARAVVRLAERLVRDHELAGAEATGLILADGPLQHGDLLRHIWPSC